MDKLSVYIFLLVVLALPFSTSTQATPADSSGNTSQLPVKPNYKLGLAFPGKQVKYYPVLSQAGLGIVRLGVSWKYREPKKNKYNWKPLDKQVISLQKLGIKPFLTLYSDAGWAVRDKKSGVKNKRPKNIRQWQNFIMQLVERYDNDGENDVPGLKAKVHYYQVANEWISPRNKSGGWAGTSDELIEYINASYAAVKKSDPNAKFVMGGIAAFNLDVMSMLKGYSTSPVHQKFSKKSSVTITKDMLKAKGYYKKQHEIYKVLENSQYDYADVHLYGETRRNKNRVSGIKQHIGGRPIVSTECGGPSLDYKKAYTDDDHFNAVFDWNLSALSHGVEFCLWFQLAEGQGATWGNRKVALFDKHKKHKPGYWAYQLLSSLLNNSVEVKSLTNSLYRIRYSNKKPVLVAWAPDLHSNLSADDIRMYLNIQNPTKNSAIKLVKISNSRNGRFLVNSKPLNKAVNLSTLPVIIGEELPGYLGSE